MSHVANTARGRSQAAALGRAVSVGRDSEPLAFGLTYYHNLKLKKVGAARYGCSGSGSGWVAASVASCLLASPPGVGASLLESHASTARPRDKASRRPSGKNSRGARAAFGGVWRLGAAGCCKRRGEHVRALGCVPSALQRTFPWGSSGVAAPVLCSCTAELSQRTTGPRSGRGATLTAQRRVAHVEQAGVQRPVVRAAWAASRGLA